MIQYEELIAGFHGQSRRIVEAAGLKWDKSCHEPHRCAQPVRTASVRQARRPVYQSGVNHWRNYEPALSTFFLANQASTQGVLAKMMAITDRYMVG